MDLAVGKRISLGPHQGTIRYRGAVPPASGEWLGIEWDDPSRGKHDGTSADGTRYFHVRIPGSGSFIRPTASKLSSGCCFVEAIRNKYAPAHDDPPTADPGPIQQLYSRKTIADIEIEAPNLDRISRRAARLDRLKEVGLGGWQQSSLLSDADGDSSAQYSVARAFDAAKGYPEGSVRSTCPNIRWLDLSRSLIAEWEEVSLIAGELERLQTLLLHCTRLQPLAQPLPPSWSQRLGHLQDLRLDATFMQWNDVLQLAPALTGLKHLQLGGNGLTSLAMPAANGSTDPTSAVLPSLTSLSLEENELASWPELVAALSRLPCLESINLNRNRFADIPPAPAAGPRLPKLRELHLRGNRLESWSSLEHISQWLEPGQKLAALHIYDMQEEEAAPDAERTNVGLLARYEYRDLRAVAIARLGDLRVLDKTEITSKERKDAELFVYTRFRQGDAHIIEGTPPSEGSARSHNDERKTLELSTADIAARFPRFIELAQQFETDSEPAPMPVKQESRNTLRANMLSLNVIASSEAPASKQPHVAAATAQAEVRILATTPLRIAKIKLAAVLRVRPDQVARVWALLGQAGQHDEAQDRIVLEIDDLSRNLDWYEVRSGDQLVLVTE